MSATQAAPRPQAPAGVLNTLLAFEQAPGRYAVVLREPRLLFDYLQVVMQLAAGREVPELVEPLKQQPQARHAARFFVRTVMLRPGADHYTLLGLTPGFEPATLREHYRLMIRMTHPDFAGDDGEWPADAATRINLANDVLSSSVRRAEYNASLGGAGPGQGPSGAAHAARKTPPVAARPLPAAAVLPPRRAKPAGQRPAEAWTMRLKVALASLGALGAGWALLVMNPSGSDSSLVVQIAKSQGSGKTPESGQTLTALPDAQAAVETPVTQPIETPRALRVNANAVRADLNLVANEQEALSRPVRRGSTAQESAVPVPMVQVAASAVAAVPSPVAPLQAEPSADAVTAGLSLAAAKTLSPAHAEGKALAAPSVAPASQMTTAAVAPNKTAAANPVLSAEQVKPLLAKIVQRSRGGLGVPVAGLIHPSVRVTPASQAFVFAFQDELAGMKVLDVVRTDMNSRETPEGLVVDMKMTFQVEDTNGWAATRNMNLRAHFSQIEHSPALTRLVVNP